MALMFLNLGQIVLLANVKTQFIPLLKVIIIQDREVNFQFKEVYCGKRKKHLKLLPRMILIFGEVLEGKSTYKTIRKQ